MKKIYMQPLTEVVKINTEQMICQSLEIIEGNPDKILMKDDSDFDLSDATEINVNDLW